LSGGEPLLRDDLPVLVARAREHGLIVQLSTNGLLLKEDVFYRCVVAGLDYVTISLDALDPRTFSQLRGVCLSKVLEGIDFALQLHETHDHLHVGLKCVVSRLSLYGVFDLIGMAIARQLYLGLQPFHTQFGANPEAASHLGFSQDDLPNLEAVFEEILQSKQESNLLINHAAYLAHFPQWLAHGTLPFGFSCPAGEETVNIDVHLNLKPCWTFSPIGNLLDRSLASLWVSPAFESVRVAMRTQQCEGCWLTCHTDL
jgi:MoaA/NifB/PqqE/SkfB family radical SAM enzyme